MAGLYPGAPGRRMAWDSDGSLLLTGNGNGTATPPGPFTEKGLTDKQNLNDEDRNSSAAFSTGSNTDAWGVFIFPELRELDGWFGWADSTGSSGSGSSPLLQTSTDTTNGLDGTWTTQSSSADLWVNPLLLSDYRDGIVSMAVNGIRAVRVRGRHSGIGGRFDSVRGTHIYGTISPGETPDRLLFIDELTGLEFTAVYDYEEVPRGSARDKEFRLKNNSTVAGNNKTINTIQFTAEDLYLGSGAWYTFSIGGGAFQATQAIASLAPEASSSLIVMRQIIPEAAILWLHAARLRATHTSLS